MFFIIKYISSRRNVTRLKINTRVFLKFLSWYGAAIAVGWIPIII